jgi:hypothetical protein
MLHGSGTRSTRGNNVNNLPEGLNRKKSNTPENGNLTGYQKKLVEKLVTELNGYDNMFYEIQNEPWSDDPQNRCGSFVRLTRNRVKATGSSGGKKHRPLPLPGRRKWQLLLLKQKTAFPKSTSLHRIIPTSRLLMGG